VSVLFGRMNIMQRTRSAYRPVPSCFCSRLTWEEYSAGDHCKVRNPLLRTAFVSRLICNRFVVRPRLMTCEMRENMVLEIESTSIMAFNETD
jgi:hypothetical protein